MRVQNGKITEHWGVANLLSLMQQIGGWNPPTGAQSPAAMPSLGVNLRQVIDIQMRLVCRDREWTEKTGVNNRELLAVKRPVQEVTD
jgi:hypothetical protein